MSGELSFSLPGLTGSTLYAIIRRPSDGFVRDVVIGSGAGAWEAWNDASIDDYDVAMTEQGASGRFLGDVPTGVSAPYAYEVCKKLGVSPAITDPIVGQGEKQAVAGGAAGPGAISFTYTLTNALNDDPIPGVDVWVTTDEAGEDVVAGTLVTDAFGQVTFQLDAGTYFFWRQAAGWTFNNPDQEEVV